jgi:hypothetical protein
MRFRAAILTLLIAAAGLLSPAWLAAQNQAKRLILKDGSYQAATKWEKKGDRVRYFSAERNDWEEVPDELVDWPATEKFEKDRVAGAPSPEAVELDKELEAERKADELKTPEVAPRLRLPDTAGVFLLDNYKSEPQLVEIEQGTGELNRDTKGNILRAAVNPIATAKQNIELKGEHARVQSHVTTPSIYVNSNLQEEDAGTHVEMPQQPEGAIDRFKIVRMQAKGDKRIVGDIKIAIYGKVSQEQKIVPSNSRELTGGWIKVTPNAPLAPGEYAVVELLGKEGMNLYVWDFGVNPNAAANQMVFRPDVPAQPEPPKKPVELEQRPKQ